MAEHEFVCEVAVDGKDDWQRFGWVDKSVAREQGIEPVCGLCFLPCFSLSGPPLFVPYGGPEVGYWEGLGEGDQVPAICQRHVGVPVA